jgi:hypothetical protein
VVRKYLGQSHLRGKKSRGQQHKKKSGSQIQDKPQLIASSGHFSSVFPKTFRKENGTRRRDFASAPVPKLASEGRNISEHPPVLTPERLSSLTSSAPATQNPESAPAQVQSAAANAFGQVTAGAAVYSGLKEIVDTNE